MLWSLPLALYIHHNQMPHVSNPQKLRIFWQRAVLEKNIPTLTHPTLEHAWFCLSTWDPCVFELNFDIKKSYWDWGLVIVVFQMLKQNVMNRPIITYYYVSWKVLFNPSNLMTIAPLEHIHLITNLKRMLFLNLINCTWDPKFERMLRKSRLLPGDSVFCI